MEIAETLLLVFFLGGVFVAFACFVGIIISTSF